MPEPMQPLYLSKLVPYIDSLSLDNQSLNSSSPSLSHRRKSSINNLTLDSDHENYDSDCQAVKNQMNPNQLYKSNSINVPPSTRFSNSFSSLPPKSKPVAKVAANARNCKNSELNQQSTYNHPPDPKQDLEDIKNVDVRNTSDVQKYLDIKRSLDVIRSLDVKNPSRSNCAPGKFIDKAGDSC